MEIGLTILFFIGIGVGFGLLCMLCKTDETSEKVEEERRKILIDLGL